MRWPRVVSSKVGATVLPRVILPPLSRWSRRSRGETRCLTAHTPTRVLPNHGETRATTLTSRGCHAPTCMPGILRLHRGHRDRVRTPPPCTQPQDPRVTFCDRIAGLRNIKSTSSVIRLPETTNKPTPFRPIRAPVASFWFPTAASSST